MENKKIKKNKKFIILIIIVILVIVFLIFRPKGKEEPKIEFEQIEKRDIATSISATGVINTDTTQNINSKLTGFKIKTVNVKEGDRVSAGDVICTFDTSSLEENLKTAQNSLNISQAQGNIGIQSAQRNLNDAITSKDTQISTTQAEVNAAQSRYEEAKKQLDTAKNVLSTTQGNLDSIKKSYDQIQIAFSPIEKEYKRLETELNSATDDLKSKEAAYKNADVSTKTEREQEYKDAETRFNAATSQFYAYKPTYETKLNEYTTIKNNYDSLVSGVNTAQATVSQLETTVNSLKSTYDTLVNTLNTTSTATDSTIAGMRDALSNTELSASLNTQTQESQIKSIQEQIAEGILKSTVNGTVTSVSVKAGDLYSGTTIAVIEGEEVFVVEAEIDEYDIADIKNGMKVLIKTDATRDEELEGTVIYTASSATTNTMPSMGSAATTMPTSSSATYKVKIALNNQNDRLRLGMNARLSIITDSKEKVWSVPNDAVYERENGSKYIEILKDEKTGEKEELDVTTGIEGSYYIEIISDKLKDGMKVVLPTGNSSDSIEALIELMGADAGI